MSTPAETVTPVLLKNRPVNRDAADKSDRGTVLVVGGKLLEPTPRVMAELSL